MTLDPRNLQGSPDIIESVEKASTRLVAQAVYDFLDEAKETFQQEPDLVADIGEDITREALDRLGTSAIPVRLFGKIDYKRARDVFHPEYSIRQALFVDSKAEKISGQGTATIQTAQTSMHIRQMRAGKAIDEAGKLPFVITRGRVHFLTTNVFVKYNYSESATGVQLQSITVACLPNGMLQMLYNPSALDTFWVVGRNAPSLGEEFRARISFGQLKKKANWRVQRIQATPKSHFVWED